MFIWSAVWVQVNSVFIHHGCVFYFLFFLCWFHSGGSLFIPILLPSYLGWNVNNKYSCFLWTLTQVVLVELLQCLIQFSLVLSLCRFFAAINQPSAFQLVLAVCLQLHSYTPSYPFLEFIHFLPSEHLSFLFILNLYFKAWVYLSVLLASANWKQLVSIMSYFLVLNKIYGL